MPDLQVFIGLDVSKAIISLALVHAMASTEIRFYGTIANERDALRRVRRGRRRMGGRCTLAMTPPPGVTVCRVL
jgi:hypothetical protein